MEKQNLTQLTGSTRKFRLPSGFNASIREQNGHDDDILSNEALAKDLTNIDMFICNIVMDTDLPFANNNKLTMQNVGQLLLKDKYFLLFASRIHSMGSIMKIKFDWGKEDGGEMLYEEDIEKYIWDYNEPMPQPGEEGYFDQRMQPYEVDNPFEWQNIVLKSGKNLRFKLLNIKAEKEILKLKPDEVNRNVEIRKRFLEQEVEGGNWVKVSNFKYFSKRDMIELHKLVFSIDKPFTGLTELQNPKTGQVLNYPVIQSPDFLYPEEI